MLIVDMDRYDINGYFTKAEATEDKLYSLVKSGVRQFLTLQTGLGMCSFMDHIVKASASRATMEQLGADDDKYVIDDEHNTLLKVAGGPHKQHYPT